MAAHTDWPAVPSHMELSTPYGFLHVMASEYVYESRLLINNEPVDPLIEGLLNITYSFALPKSQAALVSVSNGSSQCPVSYRWIILSEKGSKVSESFGSCSALIKVSATGRNFTMETPSAAKPDKIDVYVYDGKKIRHHIKP